MSGSSQQASYLECFCIIVPSWYLSYIVLLAIKIHLITDNAIKASYVNRLNTAMKSHPPQFHNKVREGDTMMEGPTIS